MPFFGTNFLILWGYFTDECSIANGEKLEKMNQNLVLRSTAKVENDFISVIDCVC